MAAGRILVIDDNPLVREIWADFLGLLGHEVTTAEDAAEGLSLFESKLHDVVVTDLLLTGATGWQIVAAVRRRIPRTPVIIVTGSGTSSDEEQAAAEGVVLLTKPVDLPVLGEAVGRALASHPDP